MKVNIEKVKTEDGQEWSFEMPMPESTEEAAEIFGEENALFILNSGLKVKLQAIARENFKAGKDKAEIEELIRKYRPGTSARASKRSQATQLLIDKGPEIRSDPELRAKIEDTFTRSKWQEVIELIESI